MAIGKIKDILRDRGFGFIREAGASEDVFFHTAALATGILNQLEEGQTVEFDREQDPRDPRRSRGVNLLVVGKGN